MVNRIDIIYKIEDTRAKVKKRAFDSLVLKGKIKNVVIADSYLINAALNNEQIEKVADLLINPLLERSSINVTPVSSFDWMIEIGLLPGVTDNVGSTAKEIIEDYFRKQFSKSENVFASRTYFLSGQLELDDILKIAESLYNPLIQQATIKSFEEIKSQGMPKNCPKVDLQKKPQTISVDMNVSDKELEKIGTEGIADPQGFRRGPLSLSLNEIKAIKQYFKKLKRDPTDIELESLAQTWSEHCKHNIFNDPIDEIKDGLFKKYIKKATDQIRSKKYKDFCVSVFNDNSGAIEFDENYLITYKVETHNSPSALDPFGGALTGIVGVNRDTLGFGLGAKPIINTYGFCFADPNASIILYRDKNKTQKMLPPRRVLDGVVEGVNVGGNSSGIPTPLGFIYFDDRYAGKPLVFVGTVGLIPKKVGERDSHKKKARPGDYIVMIGGRVGIDGIHGATFSSESLTIKSQTSSVQIGDPITQKKLSDAIIREARDMRLFNSITDNGAGGLSSSVGEMAQQSGGCRVNLEKVPLKYPGLDPWQIWISESQERMTLAIPKGNWGKFADLMRRRGVEATVIGEFTNSGRCIVEYHGMRIMDVAMEFLHNGRPPKKQRSKKIINKYSSINFKPQKNLTETIETMLSQPNIASFEFVSTQFDHTVQGNAVLPPLHGKGRVNSNATVIKPLFNSKKGIVLSYGINPHYSDVDAYFMAAAAIDSAIRGAVSVGGNPDYLALLDNFCWSSSDKPERLYQLKQAVRACYDYSVAYSTPFISGKDSMFNDFKGFDKNGRPINISIPPTLLISSIGIIDDISKTVTLDFKKSGDLIYLLGETSDQLNIDADKNKRLYRFFYQAIQKDLIASSISLALGGLAIGVAKSAIGGMLGCEINLGFLGTGPMRDDFILFSESQGRILISIAENNKQEFEKIMQNTSYYLIGKVSRENTIKIKGLNRKLVVNLNLEKAQKAYKSTFRNY